MENPLLERSRPVIRRMNDLRLDRKGLKAFQLRKKLRWHYSFAIPNEKAIQSLVELSPIVEMGAGSGYWAMLISEMGGEIVCFDKHFPNENKWLARDSSYFPIQKGTSEVLNSYGDHTLFLCWPNDYNQETGWSDRALEIYLESGGSTLALISEGKGGAAGSDRLFDLIEKRMIEDEVIFIPKFPSLHDYLGIYERK